MVKYISLSFSNSFGIQHHSYIKELTDLDSDSFISLSIEVDLEDPAWFYIDLILFRKVMFNFCFWL